MGASTSKLKNVKYENPITVWQIQGDLGSGTYGKVHLVRNRQTGQKAAAKIASVTDNQQLQDFATEIDILTGCRHDNITNFIDAYYNNNDLWILIELCEAGALAKVLEKTKDGMDEVPLACVAHQMLMALDFLHNQCVIHRDINCSNTLITEHGTIKVADFGVSALNKSPDSKRGTFVGSPHWMAPEVVACEKDASKTYTNKADLWSFGITLIELAQKQPPHHNLHPIKVLFKIVSAKPPTVDESRLFSAAFHRFLANCLVKDPSARPSAFDLSKDEWLQHQGGKPVLAKYCAEL